MKKRLIGIRIIIYGYVFLLTVYTGVLVGSLLVPRMVVISAVAGQQAFSQISLAQLSFPTYVFISVFIYGIQLKAVLDILRLKEKGRSLLVVTNGLALLCLAFFNKSIIEQCGLEFLLALSILNVAAGVFFIRPNVKELFHARALLVKKILVIDDDRGLLRMLKVNLAAKGFDVLTAATGEKGLKFARKYHPHLIILDVILPGIKGRQVCAKLKEDTRTKDIPVVFLTSKDSPDDINAAKDLGAIAYVTKPVDSKGLLQAVHKILGVQ